MLQGFVVDVVVTQVPELNNSSHKSGHIDEFGILP